MNNLHLYRGFKNSFSPGEYQNKYLECPRRPLNTPVNIHLEADEWFNTRFGYRFRSQALFCYGSKKRAMDYGTVGIIEPIGEHQLCWSPTIVDFYGSFIDPSNTVTVEQLLDSGDYQIFTVTNRELLEEATRSENEIMLWCKSFRVSICTIN